MMGIDKATTNSLKRFADVFKEARDRGANESDTVMYLVKFFEDVLGYDSLNGEISKELAIKDRFCDVALKLDGTVKILVECKAASIQALVEKHIEQAENYASRAGIRWVLLTNGIEWRLYHLTFAESEGITHEVAFDANLLGELDSDSEALWGKLCLLSRDSVEADSLEHYWSQKKALGPAAVVRALLGESVLTSVRRELNRDAPARLELEDVFAAVRDVLSKDAIVEAGDLSFTKRRKRRRKRKITTTDVTTGQTIEQEIEEDVDDVAEVKECPPPAVLDLGSIPPLPSPNAPPPPS